jgi:hypothetical protein
VASEDLKRPYDAAPGQMGDQAHSAAPGPRLTPAEQHALRRSAPLSPEKFEELGRLAARGINPLRRL